MCLSPSEENTGHTRKGGGEPEEESKPGMRQRRRVIRFPLIGYRPVPERDRKDTGPVVLPVLVDAVEGPTDGFGSLRTVLEAVSAAHSNHEVCI